MLNYIKEFFITIHRSITDPLFYKEVIHYSKLKVLMFIIALLVFSSIIIASFHYARISDKENGLPRYLPHAFSEVTITPFEMINKREHKYIVDPITVNEIIKLMTDYYSREDLVITDSLVLINGKDDVSPSKESSVIISFNKSNILVKYKNNEYKSLPYKLMIPKGSTAIFTSESVSDYLLKHFHEVYIQLFILHVFKLGFHFISSVIFLTIAAFIFKRNIINGFLKLFKLSLYASTVLAIEGIVTSAAGYSSLFTWYVAVFISIFALFRGLNSLTRDQGNKENQTTGIF